ncbi:ABC transporter permease [Stackebrandtia nassauensis]|uniref:Xylose transport system permease protein XylH n=1 Tax=Stackebrandtia nassauensis (strain DSM 44728 / CIP 108903 / NRRL B-16338 / NBRC 102104 / LLR-40K-21) TaxID=446470 RepID=D3Q6W9_STANL|nr:ABC transporter permease [Stackebrandtia nassauensis]ADD40368.1 inner-membrane translocator [Stackebrandtia nassauensis DSM 44728]
MSQTTSVAAEIDPVASQVSRRPALLRLLTRPEFGSLVGAIAVFAVFYALAPTFRNASSWSTILYETSTIGIMAVAVALLMIGGEFDLSAGVGVIATALFGAIFTYQLSVNVWVGVFASLAFGLAVGFVNGWLLVRTKLPSFLVTLSTFLMLQGLNVALTKLITGSTASDRISDMDGFAAAEAVFASEFSLFGVDIQITVLWWLLFVGLATWVLLRTRVGNWIYASGGDADSARAVGVPVNRVKIGLFMVMGAAAWFSGMHLLFEYNTVQSGEGIGNELLYIMAAVIGGCLLTGGYGTAVGAAIGALIYGMTKQGIVYAGWDDNWLMFFVGAMLLLATVINAWVRRQAGRR